MKFIKSSYLYIDSRVDIFCPMYNEYLWDIISIIKNDNKYISDSLLKEFTLSYINEMLSKDLIYIGSEWNKNKRLIKWIKPIEQTINDIAKMWFEGADFGDFYGMVWFGYEDWYLEALKNEGFRNKKMLWKDFVKNNIGDLEQWIEKNRPKTKE